MKVLNIYILFLYFGFGKSQQFISDPKCLYEESGASFTFDTTPNIDFYIPHNWVNSADKLNYLLIELFSTDLVLRHPSSSNKGPNEISLPLESMKVGWNRLFLRKDGNNLQVIERPPDNSIKVIQTITLQPDQEPLRVLGLYSLANCLKDLNTRYYKIPAGKSVKIPYVMFKQVDRFDAFSDSSAFNFEVTFSGKKQQVCKEEIAGQPAVYSLPKVCRHWPTTSFSQNTIYNVFMYPEAFDAKDILRFQDFTFTEFIFHNTGGTDFFVRTFIKPESNAPISLLKADGAVPPTERPTQPETPDDGFTYEGCGENPKKSLLNRIVGGRTSGPKDWPWMAALLKNDGSLLCGGTLITDRHVLSAAHCFKDHTINEVKVRLGEYDFGTPNADTPPDFRIISYLDPNYNLDNRDNDIAILKLERATLFSEIISPICLPPPFKNYERRRGIVAGWGLQSAGGQASNVLREIVIPIFLRHECVASFHRNAITDNMFCAGLKGRDSCQGDSGGPFMIQESDGRWHIVGIVSWGDGCGLPGKPGVYTKVDNYLNWINRNLN